MEKLHPIRSVYAYIALKAIGTYARWFVEHIDEDAPEELEQSS